MTKWDISYRTITTRDGEKIIFERPIRVQILEDDDLLMIVPDFHLTIQGSTWTEVEFHFADYVLREVRAGENLHVIDKVSTIIRPDDGGSYYVMDSCQSEVSFGH